MFMPSNSRSNKPRPQKRLFSQVKLTLCIKVPRDIASTNSNITKLFIFSILFAFDSSNNIFRILRAKLRKVASRLRMRSQGAKSIMRTRSNDISLISRHSLQSPVSNRINKPEPFRRSRLNKNHDFASPLPHSIKN